MTPRTPSKRRRMIEGTKVLWSTVTYVPVILFAGLMTTVFRPILAPLMQPETPLSKTGVIVVLAFMVIAGYFALRYKVWQPLRELAEDCEDPRVFHQLCVTITKRAMPYVPLMALPIATLCFDLGGTFMLLQVGLILLADHYIEKWRVDPITEAVDNLLA